MNNLVLGFLKFNLRYKSQQFYEFSISKILVNFHDFDIFRKHLNKNVDQQFLIFFTTIGTIFNKPCIQF
jgi:hypothetical protein